MGGGGRLGGSKWEVWLGLEREMREKKERRENNSHHTHLRLGGWGREIRWFQMGMGGVVRVRER